MTFNAIKIAIAATALAAAGSVAPPLATGAQAYDNSWKGCRSGGGSWAGCAWDAIVCDATANCTNVPIQDARITCSSDTLRAMIDANTPRETVVAQCVERVASVRGDLPLMEAAPSTGARPLQAESLGAVRTLAPMQAAPMPAPSIVVK